MKKYYFKEESKKDWYREAEKTPGDIHDMIKLGSLMRIAAAAERIAVATENINSQIIGVRRCSTVLKALRAINSINERSKPVNKTRYPKPRAKRR